MLFWLALARKPEWHEDGAPSKKFGGVLDYCAPK